MVNYRKKMQVHVGGQSTESDPVTGIFTWM